MRKICHGRTAVLLLWLIAVFAVAPSVWSWNISSAAPSLRYAAPLAITFIVTNKNDSGAGSLRQAILDANSNPGTDTISFNIPGQGVQTIAPTSALPIITDPVIIDGTAQPGFSGTPIIELNGAGNNFDALNITAGNSTVTGLVINRFQRGIILRTAGGNTVRGNFIGTDSSGTAALPNLVGISITSADNTIGGAAPGWRNVIAGNDTAISIDGNSATGNRVLGNYIGTNMNGTGRPSGFAIARFGVRIANAANNFVGGTGSGEGNVISGHANEGVRIENGMGNQVSGNYIGTGADGTLALGNALMGVRILGSTNNLIGGLASAAGNTIGYNFVGVSVECNPQCSVGNSILGNFIFSNTSLGIDLAGDRAVSQNDATDADVGPNNLQNYPLLTSVAVNAGGTTLAGTLNSTPNTTFRIEFFANGACDLSGYGEGTLYFGSTTAVTDASGNASFNVSFPTTLPSGQVLTATATDPAGNTSEFSACATGGSSGSVGFSTFNYSVFEDAGSAIITLIRQGGSSGTLAVNYATSNITATAGQDYVATSGTLMFANGETTKTFTVPILTDAANESTEDVSLTLTRAPGAPADSVSTSNQAVLSIKDSGLLPVLSIDCGNMGEICLPVSVVEGNAGVTNALFTVRLSGDARGKAVSVDFETTGQTATSGTDFQPTSGMLVFPAGVTTQTISVPVNGDTLDEADESFRVVLKNPLNATISDSSAGFGSIIDDDLSPTVSINDILVTEPVAGSATASFTVNLSAPSGQSVTVNFATLDGSASAGTDYTATSGALTFNPGEVVKSVAISIHSDSFSEASETFFVNLTSPTNATLVRSQGTCTIVSDSAPQLMTEDNSQIALAFTSATMIRDPFPTEDPYNFAPDRRTRILLFATNVNLQPGEDFSVVVAQAKDSSQKVYPLTVEYVGKVAGLSWLTQINIRLSDELIGGEDIRVSISLRGVASNEVIVRLLTPASP